MLLAFLGKVFIPLIYFSDIYNFNTLGHIPHFIDILSHYSLPIFGYCSRSYCKAFYTWDPRHGRQPHPTF